MTLPIGFYTGRGRVVGKNTDINYGFYLGVSKFIPLQAGQKIGIASFVRRKCRGLRPNPPIACAVKRRWSTAGESPG